MAGAGAGGPFCRTLGQGISDVGRLGRWHRSVLFRLMKTAGWRRVACILPTAGIGPDPAHSTVMAAGHLLSHLFKPATSLAQRPWGKVLHSGRRTAWPAVLGQDVGLTTLKSLKGAGLAGRRVLGSPLARSRSWKSLFAKRLVPRRALSWSASPWLDWRWQLA